MLTAFSERKKSMLIGAHHWSKPLTVPYFVRIEHGQQLSVEGHKPRPNQVGRVDQLLNDFQRRAHDFDVLCVESVFYGNYELGDNRVDFVAAVRQQILNALTSESFVRMLGLR